MTDIDFEVRMRESGGKVEDGKLSVSGVQEKFGAVVDGNKLRLAQRGERSTHILKPVPAYTPLLDRHELPANEHVTMQIASQVYGIATAPNGICFDREGRPVYVTRRFDIKADGSKHGMEDFASLLGKTSSTGGKNFKYTGSYADIADIIRTEATTRTVDLERFFNLVVFNYIHANGDAHLKNFSLMEDGGETRLSPAYDLICTSLHVADEDFALEGGLRAGMEKSDIYDRSGHPCREDFRTFGRSIGLQEKRIERILDRYQEIPAKEEALIAACFLTAKQRRSYLRIVRERSARFNRGK